MHSRGRVFIDRSVVNEAATGLLRFNELINHFFTTSKKCYT